MRPVILFPLLLSAALLAAPQAHADELDPRVAALLADGRLKLERLAAAERVRLPGPRDVSLLRVTVAAGVREPAHVHPGLEFVHILQGSGAVELDGRDVAVKPGDTVRVDKGVRKALAAGQGEPLVVLAVLVLESGKPPLAISGARP